MAYFLIDLSLIWNTSRVLLFHGPRLLDGGERGHSGLLHALASAGKWLMWGLLPYEFHSFERNKGLFIYRLKLAVSSSPLRHPCAGSSTRARGHHTLIVPGACMAKPGFRKTFFSNRTDFNIVQGTGGQSQARDVHGQRRRSWSWQSWSPGSPSHTDPWPWTWWPATTLGPCPSWPWRSPKRKLQPILKNLDDYAASTLSRSFHRSRGNSRASAEEEVLVQIEEPLPPSEESKLSEVSIFVFQQLWS